MSTFKKDKKVLLGIVVVILVLIAIFALFFIKSSNNALPVPQVTGNTITYDTINTPSPKDLLKDKKKTSMQEVSAIQTIKKESGLIINLVKEGSGLAIKTGDTAVVDYRGFLADGSIFDESYKRGQPFSFVVGQGMVIPGWEEGVLGMKIGEVRRLTIPSDLAYGPAGYPPVIPANATLTFDIELKAIK